MGLQYYEPKEDYKVLVRCFTYNQSKYIKDALNGFAIQQTDFPFVCLVMDDCSTDGEQDVIKAWMEQECNMQNAERMDMDLSEIFIVPHRENTNCTFAFYLLKKNLYRTKGKRPLVAPLRAHCKYEAPCEGDDYWLVKDKLQRQVDFLDSHPDYTACWHYALVKWQNHKRPDKLLNNYKAGDFSVADVVRNWQIQFSTIVIRTSIINSEVFTKIKSAFSGSYNYFLASAVAGKCYGFDEAMSVYRKNDGGISASVYSGARATLNAFKANFAMVYATEDKEAIAVQDSKGYNYLKKGGMYHWLLRKEIDVEIVNLLNKYNKSIFWKALPWGFIYPLSRVRKYIPFPPFKKK